MKVWTICVAALLAAAGSVSAAGAAPASGPDPSEFPTSLHITNKYSPMVPGTTFIYDGNAGADPKHVTVRITHTVKTIEGIPCVEVLDTVYVAGQLEEKTKDWFAQDDDGNVWYFGEFATEYANGVVIGHTGSWQAGQDGAQPGIVMEAKPRVGDTYRQEFAPGVAEDMATVLSLRASVSSPYRSFSGNALLTKEFSSLDPGKAEHKYYGPGVGLVKAKDVQGGNDQITLTTVTH